jgi:phosphatidylglycerol:prolipoprotein diacylglycerol transferase
VLPTVAQIGPLTIGTFSLLIDLGIAAALATLYFRAPAGKKARWVDAGIAGTIGAFTGARLLHIVVNGDYFLPNLGEIVSFWQGGLAWPGAAGGAVLGAWLYCRRAREPLAPILDAAALPAALAGLLAWGGCLAAGCGYGYEVFPDTFPAWATSHAPDLFGLSVPRFPTQALGLAWSALSVLLVAQARRRRRWPAGALGAYALSQVALGMFALGFTRGDPAPLIGGYRLDVVGSAIVLLAATAAWAWRVLRPPSALPPGEQAGEAPAAPTSPQPDSIESPAEAPAA